MRTEAYPIEVLMRTEAYPIGTNYQTIKNNRLMIINDENYEAVVAEGKPMMLDFWATWCGPCKKIGPDIEALAEQYEGQVIVGKVNVEEADELATKFKIRNVPTVLYIKNGEVVDKIVGATTKDKFEEKLKALL